MKNRRKNSRKKNRESCPEISVNLDSEYFKWKEQEGKKRIQRMRNSQKKRILWKIYEIKLIVYNLLTKMPIGCILLYIKIEHN